MRILFYMGWVGLVAAFVSAATEPFLVQLGRGGLMTSTYDLWYALAPGNLVVMEIRIERLWPALWDPVLVTLLTVPAWLLSGVPGLLLTWFCRPNRIMSPEVREEYDRLRESLFVIDELSAQARLDENYDPQEDDRAPSHLLFNLHKSEDEDIRDSVFDHDVPAGYHSPDYADEYIRDVERGRQAAEELRALLADPVDRDQVRIVDSLTFSGPRPTPADDADKDDSAPEDPPDKLLP